MISNARAEGDSLMHSHYPPWSESETTCGRPVSYVYPEGSEATTVDCPECLNLLVMSLITYARRGPAERDAILRETVASILQRSDMDRHN